MIDNPSPLATFRLDVHVHLHDVGGDGDHDDLFNRLKESLMSAFSEKLDRLEQAIEAGDAKVQEDVDELKRRVEANTATPEEESRFEALIARAKGRDPLPDFPATEPVDDGGALPDDPGTVTPPGDGSDEDFPA